MPAEHVFLQDGPGRARLEVDSAIYSLPAILRACYWFTDRAYLLVTRAAPGQYRIELVPKDPGQSHRDLAGELANSLLDHQVRVELQQETRTIRELIVAKAFAEGDLLEDAVPGGLEDPVQAGCGWNELVGGGGT